MSGERGSIRSADGGAEIRVATYNIHGWIGSDGLCDPIRTLGLIKRLDADIVALQEVKLPIPGVYTETDSYLERYTSMHAVTGPTLLHEEGSYGNVLLSRLPVISSKRFDLSYGDREPRGALDVDIEVGGRMLRVISTHLGLHGPERHWQVERLEEVIEREVSSHMILMGDFNEWLFFSRAMRRMHRILHSHRSPRSFHSRFPVLPLDRIWVRPDGMLRRIRAFKEKGAKNASDHLPVIAELVI